MDTQQLFSKWSAARNEVVKAATRFLYEPRPDSRAELGALLVAERVARLAFEKADRDDRLTVVSP